MFSDVQAAVSSSSILKSGMMQLRAVQHQQQPQSQRIKELEEEVQRLTVENAKVKTDLEKMQRRWERLKEGARRRRRESSNPAEEEDSVKENTEST